MKEESIKWKKGQCSSIVCLLYEIKPANRLKCFPTTLVANSSHLKVGKMNFPQLEARQRKAIKLERDRGPRGTMPTALKSWKHGNKVSLLMSKDTLPNVQAPSCQHIIVTLVLLSTMWVRTLKHCRTLACPAFAK